MTFVLSIVSWEFEIGITRSAQLAIVGPDFSKCRRSVRAPVSTRCREVREAMGTAVMALTVGCTIVNN